MPDFHWTYIFFISKLKHQSVAMVVWTHSLSFETTHSYNWAYILYLIFLEFHLILGGNKGSWRNIIKYGHEGKPRLRFFFSFIMLSKQRKKREEEYIWMGLLHFLFINVVCGPCLSLTCHICFNRNDSNTLISILTLTLLSDSLLQNLPHKCLKFVYYTGSVTHTYSTVMFYHA